MELKRLTSSLACLLRLLMFEWKVEKDGASIPECFKSSVVEYLPFSVPCSDWSIKSMRFLLALENPKSLSRSEGALPTMTQ